MARVIISRKLGWGGHSIPQLGAITEAIVKTLYEHLNAGATAVTNESLTISGTSGKIWTFANDNVVEGTESFKENRPEIVSFLVTHGANAAGNVTITLDDDVATAITLLATDDTPAEVAAKIAVGTWTGWTAAVDPTNAARVIFTATANEAKGVHSYASGAGTAQVETATAVGTVTTAGRAKCTLTADGLPGSPLHVPFDVVLNDDAAAIAAALRAALAAHAIVDIGAYFTIGGEGANVILTKKLAAANDDTLNIAISDGDGEGASVGVTTAATSDDTTPGVAPVGVTATVAIVQEGIAADAIAAADIARIEYAYADDAFPVAKVWFVTAKHAPTASYSHVASMLTNMPTLTD